MKIAIDASNLAQGERTGVAVYGCNLIEEFARMQGEDCFVLCYRFSRLKRRRFFFRVSSPRFCTKIVQEPLHPLFMRGLDLYHGLDARLYRSGKVKKVVTIHDLYRFTPQAAAVSHRSIRSYEAMLGRAAGIIAVSASTKKEILDRFPSVREEKIHVVHHGVEDRFHPRDPARVSAVLARYGIRKPYLLHVGCLETRKNLLRLLGAFSRVCGQRKEPLTLVLAGSRGEGADEVSRAMQAMPPQHPVICTGFVPREDLPFLYTGAEIFLYPSLYEGFGLPVLEAMACGTPVITSRVTSLPEVAGDAALLVDPHRTVALTEAALGLLASPELRREYGILGQRRASLFSWGRTARETLAVYEQTSASRGEAAG